MGHRSMWEPISSGESPRCRFDRIHSQGPSFCTAGLCPKSLEKIDIGQLQSDGLLIIRRTRWATAPLIEMKLGYRRTRDVENKARAIIHCFAMVPSRPDSARRSPTKYLPTQLRTNQSRPIKAARAPPEGSAASPAILALPSLRALPRRSRPPAFGDDDRRSEAGSFSFAASQSGTADLPRISRQ